ncbi:uncharacterized protein B0P05DRAFT_570731 [Gilbertella persicaria]|uniref:uncharacterized protein n=1 Tax=Gilbertella persicaria TaxID=101096 RepID=UPI00221EA787|nr:uncharacterized protein B0P05DRAFT_570731 [Gilbertella persicaria]KAI8083415.1 hypothetical protein B0P05DRAFT_570731 [Gilbertella persicaria]
MGNIASIGLSAAMIIGPVVGYVDQYLLIRRQKSSRGFNPVTCGVLLFAKIGKQFDTTLLLQSIAMVLAMLVLLEIVVRYKHDQSFAVLYSDLRSSFSSSSIEQDLRAEEEGFDIEQRHSLRRAWRMPFWEWDHYLDYVNCLLIFTTLVALSFLMFRNNSAYIEMIGALSLGVESTLPLPQCISNFKHRSTAGFSLLVLASWFIVCGAIQLSIDSLIVLECILFSSFVKNRISKHSWIHKQDEDQEELLQEDD